jgi:hypothetical protein
MTRHQETRYLWRQPLKWHYPVGLLFDLYAGVDPASKTAARDNESPGDLHTVYEGVVHDHSISIKPNKVRRPIAKVHYQTPGLTMAGLSLRECL